MSAPTAAQPAVPPVAVPVLADLGERLLIAEHLAHRYDGVASYGDDCAVLDHERVVTTDSCSTALVAQLGEEPWFATGWLLAAMNLSDLAAAGAEPEGLVVSYVLPRDLPVSALDGIADGVDACAREHGTAVLGGDLGEGAELRLTATAFGRCPRRRTALGRRSSTRLSRRGAAAGDHLLLVGSPGWLWAAAALVHSAVDGPGADLGLVLSRARRPVPQLRAGRALASRGLARAATDVSDGLYGSVRNLCDANGLGADLTGAIELDPVLVRVCAREGIDPFVLAQTWGDWCLLVAVRPRDVEDATRLVRAAGSEARDVGVLTGSGGLRVQDGGGGSAPWDGLDQERFTDSSWRGGSVAEAVAHLRERSARA